MEQNLTVSNEMSLDGQLHWSLETIDPRLSMGKAVYQGKAYVSPIHAAYVSPIHASPVDSIYPFALVQRRRR